MKKNLKLKEWFLLEVKFYDTSYSRSYISNKLSLG